MITVRTAPDFAALAVQLQRRAQVIGAARAEAMQLARTAPAQAWRRARLLWPLFVKG